MTCGTRTPSAVARPSSDRQNKVQRAVPDVVAIAGDPDASVRRAIVATLQALDDIGRCRPGRADQRPRRTSRVGRHRRDPPLPARESGIASLTRVNFSPQRGEWAEVVIGRSRRRSDGGAGAAGAAPGPNDSIRIKAARSIGILRGRAAVPMLVVAMKETATRACASRRSALGKIGDASAARTCCRSLSTESSCGQAARPSAPQTGPRCRADPAVHEEAALQKRQADACSAPR
jgi:hypothetical protein